MSCQDFSEWMSAYLDGELAGDARQRLEAHLAACPACRRQFDDLKRITEDLNMLRFKEPADADLARYWAGVYNRLERGLGWVLLSLGAILTLSYGAFRAIEHFVLDPAVSVVLKVGVCALIAGAVVLFVSLLRERLVLGKTDRYAKEIDR